MTIPSFATMDDIESISSWPVWLGRLAIHQDFVWFFSLIGWSLALVLWWRRPRRDAGWAWLPWSAGAAITTAVVQFIIFDPPFDFFFERLVPGTSSTYTPALIDPNWLGDVLIGAVLAGMLAGWLALAVAQSFNTPSKHSTRSARGLKLRATLPTIAGAGLAALQVTRPVTAGAVLAGASLLAASALWRRCRPRRQKVDGDLGPPSLAKNGQNAPGGRVPPRASRSRSPERTALVFAALMPALSTIGPFAAVLHVQQRDGDPTPFGLIVAAFQCLAAGVAQAGLWHEIRLAAAEAGRTREPLWRDARVFLCGALVWLVVGSGYAIQTGRDNRREVMTNRLRTAASRALTLDPALVEPLALVGSGPELRAGDAAAALALSQELEHLVQSTPFLEVARVVTLHDGWLVAVASNRPPALQPSGTIKRIRRSTPEDERQWKLREPWIEESPVPEIGQPYYCRAPIVAADGRMLGWLEFLREEFYSTSHRKWRAGPLLVTALGVVIAAILFVQRRHRREREAALREAAVAAESSRIKTAFLAKVSHELRTPLQSILGYTELLQRELPGGSSRERLAALRQHGELMIRLVNDLLDLSAIESGAFRLVEKPVAVADLVRQAVESLRPRAASKGLALHGNIDSRVPAWLAADTERVRQILLNLVGNALKFTDRGRIDVSLTLLEREGDDCLLELAVADTGPGIAPADQPRLFQAFSRLDPAAPHEGAGLGLALVAALCKSAGGDVRVESDGVNGSCFRAHLRLRVVPAPLIETIVTPAAPLDGRRILLVDDNTLVRELFAAYLGDLGAVCTLAADGEEALAAAQASPFDAVVLDLAMPRLDGRQVAQRLRASGSRVRIVGVSAHADPADRERALAVGMDTFLSKPVELAVLAAALTGEAVAAPEPDSSAQLHARLLDHFQAEAPDQIAAATAALAEQDWPALASHAHWLKNSAAVLRDDRLFAACAAVETAAAAADFAAAEQAWAECAVALAHRLCAEETDAK